MLEYKRLNLTVNCEAVYNSGILVPAHLSFEEALEYAKKHLDDVPVGVLEYIGGSETLDEDNCDFDDDNPTVIEIVYKLYADKPGAKAYVLKTERFLTPDEKRLLASLAKGWTVKIKKPEILTDEIVRNILDNFYRIANIRMELAPDGAIIDDEVEFDT